MTLEELLEFIKENASHEETHLMIQLTVNKPNSQNVQKFFDDCKKNIEDQETEKCS